MLIFDDGGGRGVSQKVIFDDQGGRGVSQKVSFDAKKCCTVEDDVADTGPQDKPSPPAPFLLMFLRNRIDN